jgi:hypothetical protein
MEKTKGLWPGFELISTSQPNAQFRAESLIDTDEWIIKIETARTGMHCT